MCCYYEGSGKGFSNKDTLVREVNENVCKSIVKSGYITTVTVARKY